MLLQCRAGEVGNGNPRLRSRILRQAWHAQYCRGPCAGENLNHSRQAIRTLFSYRRSTRLPSERGISALTRSWRTESEWPAGGFRCSSSSVEVLFGLGLPPAISTWPEAVPEDKKFVLCAARFEHDADQLAPVPETRATVTVLLVAS